MQFKTNTQHKLPFIVALGLMALLTSCGSFQYAGYDNDGIYSSDNFGTDVEQQVVTAASSDSNYYKNYFAENAAEVDALKEESEVFTDIDSYEGNYNEIEQGTLEQRVDYGGWGQNSTVTINIIDNGWYGYNDPWLWNGGFGFSYGWGRPWGWNRWGYGYGWNNWNNWGWNSGWSYGYGWNSRWCPLGYNNWGWNNGYYGRNSNRIAYHNGRRGSLLYNNNLSRRSNSALSRRDYSSGRLSSAAGLTRNSRSTAVRSNTSTRSVGNSRSTRTTRSTTSPTRSTRNTRVSRPANTRSGSSSRVSRPSNSSNTRSSGSVRSTRSSRASGSGMRSSRSSRSSSNSARSSRSSGSSKSSSSKRSRG